MANVLLLLQKTADVFLASSRVLKDKTYELLEKTYDSVFTNNDNVRHEIQRIYPKNIMVEYATFFNDPHEVYPKIYLGSAFNAASYTTLIKYNIKYIINVTSEISNFFDGYFTYYQIPIKDNNTDSIKKYFKECSEKIDEFIKNADGNIFIHCYMGASRSATIVANYISEKTGRDTEFIIQELKELRPNVNLTQQFLSDLTS